VLAPLLLNHSLACLPYISTLRKCPQSPSNSPLLKCRIRLNCCAPFHVLGTSHPLCDLILSMPLTVGWSTTCLAEAQSNGLQIPICTWNKSKETCTYFDAKLADIFVKMG
jgi:hypothetical protein